MKKRTSSSAAVSASLSEFAFILLFISAAAAAVMYGELSESFKQIDILEKEVEFLEEMLAEKEGAIVPCWKRPGSPVPEIAGTLTVLSPAECTLLHHAAGAIKISGLTGDADVDYSLLLPVLLKAFEKDINYANTKNCYVRVRVINKTNDYALYKSAAEMLKRAGLVVINE